MRFRYSRWDDTQDPLGSDLGAAELLEELSDEALGGAGIDGAMDRLLREGMAGRIRGLDDLRERVRRRRDRERESLDLAAPLEELRQRLDEIVDRERSTLSFRADDDARLRETSLSSLPPDVPGRVRELSGYRFIDPEAQRMFDELLSTIREQVMGAHLQGMVDGMRRLSPRDLERYRDMLADLNDMIERRDRGEPYDFPGFLDRHGDLLPGRPTTLDELLDAMARRMAAMSRLLASLTPEQRAELRALSDQILGDLDLAFELDRFSANLRGVFPGLPWDDPTAGEGDEPRSLSATVDALERLHDFEDLDRTLAGDYVGAALDDVDEESIRRVLGEPGVRDLRALKDVERLLERSGLVQRDHGRLEITPRGARMLGERALAQVFEELRRDREGAHPARDPGGTAEPTGQTRPWRFGDAGQIAVQRSVFNAVIRGGGARASNLRLVPDDFELAEAEERTETATALLLDLSFSMPLRGHWLHAKKTALALHALIEGRYPHDTLYMVGFSDYARRMQPRDLMAAGWERTYGTNMQHAFLMAGRLLAQHPRAARQVIMVTDGEPTAHLEGDVALFDWPPLPETVRRTLAEAKRLAMSGVRINVFMLEESQGLVRFMERLARVAAGRIFLMDDRRLGSFVVRDYVRERGDR